MNDNFLSNSESWWTLRIQIATFVLAVVMAVAGAYRFWTLDQKLANLQLDRQTEQVLQVTGNVVDVSDNTDAWGRQHRHRVRHLSVRVELKNTRSYPTRISKIELKIFRSGLGKYWENAILDLPPSPSDLPLSAGVASDDQTTADVPNNDSNTQMNVKFINLYSPDQWQPVTVDGIKGSFTYDPEKHGGGVLLGGQDRAVKFDFLVEDQDVPELLKFQVDVFADDKKATQSIHTWNDWISNGPFPSRHSNLQPVSPADPAPPFDVEPPLNAAPSPDDT